jgi:hypothetical protein
MNIRWIAVLSVCLLGACVSSDGTKRLKREDPTSAAAKTNIQLGYLTCSREITRSPGKSWACPKQNPGSDVHTSLGLLYDPRWRD